jgi:hypothetical protein
VVKASVPTQNSHLVNYIALRYNPIE